MKSLKNKTVRALGALLACASLAFGMAACSNGSGGDPQVVYVQTGTTTTTTTDTPAPAVKYTITFNANDGSENPATAMQKFTKGEAAALKSVSSLGFSKAGFYFKGWGLTADAATSSYADEAGYIAVEDKTLYALWSAVPVYSVKTPVVAGGTVTANPASGAAGTEVTLTATPKTNCYAFASFTVVDSNSNPVTVDDNGKFTLPEGGVTATATFNILPPNSPYTVITTQQIGSSVYDIVTFGSWPQTVMADGVSIDQSKSHAAGEFTYYWGSDGYWYAKIKENACESNYTYSNGNLVALSSANSYKWFKVEPIKWRVLTTNFDHDNDSNTQGKKLLLAENVLIGRRYDASKNNYQNSEIRKWLNSNANSAAASDHGGSEGFLKTAFTAAEQSAIAPASVDNSALSTNKGANPYASDTPTTDKVFLLSVREATTSAYGFDVYNAYKGDGTHNESTRIRVTTDYAKASGANQSATAGMGGCWWLRSPDSANRNGARYVNLNGDVIYWVIVSNGYSGVVPALCVGN